MPGFDPVAAVPVSILLAREQTSACSMRAMDLVWPPMARRYALQWPHPPHLWALYRVIT